MTSAARCHGVPSVCPLPMPSRKRFSSTFQKDYSIIHNVLHMVIVCNTLTAPMYDICSGDVLHQFRVYRKAAGRLYRCDCRIENPHRAARFDAGLSGTCEGWGGERRGGVATRPASRWATRGARRGRRARRGLRREKAREGISMAVSSILRGFCVGCRISAFRY